MPLLKKEDQEKFLEVLHEDMMNVNLVEVSNKAGFDFFQDIQVTIDYDASFYERIQQFLTAVKYSLVQRIIDENDNKVVSCAKAMIEFIDGGTLLKRNTQAKQSTTVSEAHPGLRKALGLDQQPTRIKKTTYKATDKASTGIELPKEVRRPDRRAGRPKGSKNSKTTRKDLVVPGEDGVMPWDEPPTTEVASNLPNEKEDLDNETF